MSRRMTYLLFIVIVAIAIGTVYYFGFMLKAVPAPIPVRQEINNATSTDSGIDAENVFLAKLPLIDTQTGEKVCAYYDDIIIRYETSAGQVGGYAETDSHFYPVPMFLRDLDGKLIPKGVRYGETGSDVEDKKQNEETSRLISVKIAEIKKEYPIEHLFKCPPSPE